MYKQCLINVETVLIVNVETMSKQCKNNTLLVKWYDRSFDADAWVRIKMSDEGKVVGFTMEAISPMTDFSFDFDDLDFKVK